MRTRAVNWQMETKFPFFFLGRGKLLELTEGNWHIVTWDELQFQVDYVCLLASTQEEVGNCTTCLFSLDLYTWFFPVFFVELAVLRSITGTARSRCLTHSKVVWTS